MMYDGSKQFIEVLEGYYTTKVLNVAIPDTELTKVQQDAILAFQAVYSYDIVGICINVLGLLLPCGIRSR